MFDKKICGNCGWFVPYNTDCGKRKIKVGWSNPACQIWVHNIGGEHEQSGKLKKAQGVGV